jgi:hypothetical protein
MKTTIVLLVAIAFLLLPIRGPAQTNTVPRFSLNSGFGVSSSSTNLVTSAIGDVSYGQTQGPAALVEMGFVNELPIQVVIDIMPGSFPNSINLKSKGVIPVAILTTNTFDATTVDPLSVEFGPSMAKEAHKKGHLEDANGDGRKDMVLHFNTQETGIQSGSTQASLSGQTTGGQVFTGTDAIVTVGLGKDAVVGDIPTTWGLEQNYPNPFNPSTSITVALPRDANVSLEIYNTLGQKVAQLLDGPMTAGYISVVFDASRLASGVYIYRLRAGDFVATRQMMLLK